MSAPGSASGVRRLAASVALDRRNDLGEGPVWDGERGLLLWVDIFAGTVESLDPASSSDRTEYGGMVGAVVPRAGGGAVLAVDRDLLALDRDGAVVGTLASVEPELPTNRFNDCRCDPQGRLWAGTLSRTREVGDGALYVVDGDLRPRPMVSGTTLSNGIGWDPAGTTMYFIDSHAQRLDAFEFDPTDGALGERRTVVEIEPAAGLPDGLAVDAEGGIWVALFGGGTVNRYTPDGRLDAVVALPVANPTCPAFGGPGLATLFVTSAIHRAPPEHYDDSPLAGALFAVEPGVPGLPSAPFKG